jgi:hypothetical protein
MWVKRLKNENNAIKINNKINYGFKFFKINYLY